jgi:uncharacterized protein DUF58
VASAAVGLDTKQSVAYQIFTFVLSIVVLSMLFALVFRVRLRIRRIPPRYGTVDQPLSYSVLVKNQDRRGQRGLILSEGLDDSAPGFDVFKRAREPHEGKRNIFDRTVGYHKWLWLNAMKRGALHREQVVPDIPPGGEVEVRVEMMPTRRGKLRFTGLTIARPDPLGIFKALRSIPVPAGVTVLPKRYTVPPLNLPGGRRYQPGGVAFASSVGDSEEFMSLRDYRPGDPLRRIHWRSWAKTGSPVVKEYQDEFFVRHALILDTFQEREYSEVFEEAVSVAASFACSVQTQDSILDLMFVGTEAYCFTSGRGLGHTDRMMDILASVRACIDKPFSSLPPLVLKRAGMLSGCICVLLSWDEERRGFIGKLKALGLPMTVLVVNEGKAVEPVDPGPMKDAPENFRVLEVGKIAEGLEAP